MLFHLVRILAVTILAGCSCKAVELLTNGDFESGSLSGWATAEQSPNDGNFSAFDNPSSAPFSFTPIDTTGFGGTYYAVSDMGDIDMDFSSGPTTSVLAQTFEITSTPGLVTLSFRMFVNDHSGNPITNASSMDAFGVPNQHARVDILTGGAGLFDTGVTVLDTLFIGADSGSIPNEPTAYSFDITSVVSTPGFYQLRFATVANQNTLVAGVDNVSIDVVPEPSSFLLLLGGPALLLLRRPSRRR